MPRQQGRRVRPHRGRQAPPETTAAAAKKAAEKSRQAASFAARHWKGALIVGGVGLMLLLVMGGLQSCTAMFGSTGTGLAATSYLSEDKDMLGAEKAYAALEENLQTDLDNYEATPTMMNTVLIWTRSSMTPMC